MKRTNSSRFTGSGSWHMLGGPPMSCEGRELSQLCRNQHALKAQ